MFDTLQSLVAPPVLERLTLVLNHVLGSETIATDKLRPHAGRTLALRLSNWPSLLPPAPVLAWRVTPAGLLEWCGLAHDGGAADLRVEVDAGNPALLIARALGGDRPAVRIDGDAALAADVGWLLANLRWDVAADLERLFGRTLAQQLHQVGRALAGALRSALASAEPLVERFKPPPRRCMKRLARLVFIVITVLRFGLDEVALSAFRQRSVRALVRIVTVGRRLDKPRGVRLREGLERLGPIFVKFGQVLSTRRDLMPLDVADELAKLQDRVPPFPAAISRSLVERAFGRPIDAVFASFDDRPVASASIAQVHLATLIGGREVAVKVLRPGMLNTIERDLGLLTVLAGWIERLSADGRRLKPREVVAEFDAYLHDELDLVREAANAAQLRRNMQGLGLVMIPEMVWDLCTPTVIVMERMHGVPISQIERLKDAGVDLKKLARDGVTIFFTQVFRDGFFHADMHPGNIQVSLAAATFGRYIALDFGIIGTLTEFDKEYLAQNFIAFFRRDYKRVAELHIESGWVPPATRVDALEGAIRAVCEPQFDRPLKDISLGQVLMRLFQTSRRFNVEIQPQLVLQKTLLNIEGLGRQLDPDLDLWTTAKPFLERWMNEQVGVAGLVERLQNEAPRYAQLLPELPRLLHRALMRREHAPPVEAATAAVAEELRALRGLMTRVLWIAALLVAAAAAAVWWTSLR